MIEAMAWGAATAIIFTFVVGIRRIPWRHAVMFGLGGGLVLASGLLAIRGVDPALAAWLDSGTLVLLGALGGGVVALSFERGERERRRRSAAILAPATLPDSNAAP